MPTDLPWFPYDYPIFQHMRVWGTLKLASLKALLIQINPDIVFLQETLVNGDKAKQLFLQCFPTWNVVALDPCGHSGGFLSGWNPSCVELYDFDTLVGIYLEGRFKQSADKVKLLNCYAPYKDRELFWHPIIQSGLLSEEGIIVGGDLNFTLSTREVWGDSARNDPLTDFFTSLIQSSGLVDVQPTKLAPTWRNGRAGSAGIAKILDRFLLDDSLIGSSSKIRSWVINSTISDHNTICLQLDSFSQRSPPPFKFNTSWIKDQSFSSLIKTDVALYGTLVGPFLYSTSVYKTKEFKESSDTMAERQESTITIISTPH
jgi:hypothetical protein